MGVHRFAPVLALCGDMGWTPCVYRRWLCALRLWNRLLRMSESRLTRKVFEADYAKCDRNWSSEIKTVMTTIGLENQFRNKQMIDLKAAKTQIDNHYSNVWSREIDKYPKLRTYKQLKTNFGSEAYLKLNLHKNERSLLSQLRCGILPLRLETGRYSNERVDERLCKLCDSGSVETEIHFIFDCKLYDTIRKQVLTTNILDSEFFINSSNVDKLICLYLNHLRKLGKFVVQAYLERRKKLYVR